MPESDARMDKRTQGTRRWVMVSGTSLDFIIMHAGDFWTSVRILDFQDFQDFVIMHAAGN